MAVPLPNSGFATFLFSDIEGSTRLWEGQPDAMSVALVRHDQLMRRAIEACDGRVFKTVGDGFYASFGSVGRAMDAAVAAQRALVEENWPTDRPIRVRMAIHSGAAEVRDDDYFGPTLNRTARLLSIGHGGQVLLSEAAKLLANDELPAGASLRDMGRHRLKDLDQAEGVSMLTHPDLLDDFPPLKSLDLLPNNLPRQLTSFVGRDAERAEATRTLAESALVSLVGAGGTGKTRLALQVAAEELENFPDGVWFVELAPLSDPALVPQAIASAIGVREGANLPIATALVEALRDRKTLLVLDNCEHLLTACANIVEAALRASPGLKVIATTREPLGIFGEALLRVPSLGVGSGRVTTAAQALKLDAVNLLVDRAKLSDPRFELTDRTAPAAVQICRRLDGIPLAIELAASRTKVLSLEQIAARLDDRFRLLTAGARTALPRQQTLRATIDWSYDLLDPQDQVLLRRVAVFAGGWTLEAAEEICEGDGLEGWEVLDGLMRLIDKSLVIHDSDVGEARYRLLESVRQYGNEKLSPEETPGLRERHAAHYSRLVIDAEPNLLGPDQSYWLEKLEREHDNIRAALAFSRTRSDLCEQALRLVGAIGRFWTVRGYLTEGREWIEGILSCAPGGATLAKANAWRTAGQIAYWQGDAGAGRRFGEESLKICRELGDREGETKSLFRLGFACLSDGDLSAARGYFEEALALGRALDDRAGIPHLLNAVGEVAYAEGKLEEAREYFSEALTRFRDFQDDRSIASVLKNLANVACDVGDGSTAHAYLAEGLQIRLTLDNPTGVAVTLDAFGVLASVQGRSARAVFLLAAAHALHETHGSRAEPSETARIDRARESADAALGREAFDVLWSEGTNATMEEAAALALNDAEPVSVASIRAMGSLA